MTNFQRYSGSEVSFSYNALSDVKDVKIKSYCETMRKKYQKQTAFENAIAEWLVRTYSAVKMLLSATVMLTSAEYAASKSLKIVEPYLLYYALFNTSRAL